MWTRLLKTASIHFRFFFIQSASACSGKRMPLLIFGGLGFQAARRVLSSLSVNSTLSVRLGMSIVMMSPFLRTEIGPPSKASGATCPMLPPVWHPEASVGDKCDAVG